MHKQYANMTQWFYWVLYARKWVCKINEQAMHEQRNPLSIHYKQNAFHMLIASHKLNINTTLSKLVLKRNNTKAEIR